MPDIRQMNEMDEWLSREVYGAMQHASNNTERSKQQQDFRLGVSNFGTCREYARRLILQEPFSDERDKTAAFIGTALGAEIERALASIHPDWLFQLEVVFHIPSGGEVTGHPDIVIPWSPEHPDRPQIVGDLKSKYQLDTVRRYGQTQQQRFQLACYAQALIDAGVFDPEKRIVVADIFYDRSAKGGEVVLPYVISEDFDPATVQEVDRWIEDVKYAVLHGEEAPRDQPREWCFAYCEYATACRGQDTDAEGLLTDPEVLAAIETYLDGAEMERTGKRMKERVQSALLGVSGSTGAHSVRWVEVGETPVSYVRRAYMKLDVRPVRSKRPPTTERTEQ